MFWVGRVESAPSYVIIIKYNMACNVDDYYHDCYACYMVINDDTEMGCFFAVENGMEVECRIHCQEGRVWCCGREAMVHQLPDCNG